VTSAARALPGSGPAQDRADRLMALVEPRFLDEVGWDPATMLLSPGPHHPLMGRGVCRVAECAARRSLGVYARPARRCGGVGNRSTSRSSCWSRGPHPPVGWGCVWCRGVPARGVGGSPPVCVRRMTPITCCTGICRWSSSARCRTWCRCQISGSVRCRAATGAAIPRCRSARRIAVVGGGSWNGIRGRTDGSGCARRGRSRWAQWSG